VKFSGWKKGFLKKKKNGEILNGVAKNRFLPAAAPAVQLGHSILRTMIGRCRRRRS